MAITSEALMNAEIAYSNKQYNEALEWYQKVLEDNPDDLYVLSRAGAICVPLGRFEEALKHFKHAKELDPSNGDNAFNYANACFFNKDNVAAFSGYVEAERLGCSEDVMPRLYYQLALICSMRQDVKSALTYIRKCEDSDRSGVISLNPDLISEKIKLYMVEQDFENAEESAAQLVAVQPSEFKNYMVYFGILMAHKNYSKAETVLINAQTYASLSNEDRIALKLQLAALYLAQGEEDKDARNEYCSKAIDLLINSLKDDGITSEQRVKILMAIAEAYLKNEEYDRSIYCLKSIISEGKEKEVATPGMTLGDDHELTPEEIEAMIIADMDAIKAKIDTGEIDGNMGLYSEVTYDEEGRLVHQYDEAAFAALNGATHEQQNNDPKEGNVERYEISPEMRERVYFSLLSAYMGKDDFPEAEKYALVLKHSGNKYYSYFGLYSEALISRKRFGSSATTREKYDRAIAYFRNKTFSDPGDSLATIFRARLYAEDSKYAKAKELALLLTEDDRRAILDYIEECKKC